MISMARMVDIGGKASVERTARARGFINLKRETIQRIERREIPKGDVQSVARTAGIMAVKKTPDSIPLTHPIPIDGANVDLEIEDEGIKIEVEVKSTGQTGVEMEALTGVTIALIAVWDMVKEFEKDESGQYPTTAIEDVKVVEKVKG